MRSELSGPKLVSDLCWFPPLVFDDLLGVHTCTKREVVYIYIHHLYQESVYPYT